MGGDTQDNEEVVHMLWIGQDIPDFAYRCIASYPTSGHKVFLWVYPQEQADYSKLPPGVVPCDANNIIPLETARRIGFYHGMGPNLKWPSWSTFSDLFRYELLFQQGGWWCDADSISVQCLYSAGFANDNSHVFATEKWRPGGYRNIIFAVPKPGTASAGERPEFINGGTRQETKAWRESWEDAPVHCCVLTNSHIRAPQGSQLMRACADILRPLMEAYSEQVSEHQLGDEAVDWALPTGGEGLRIFQEQVATSIVEGGGIADEFLAAVQHYAVFNPVEIEDFPGGMRVLKGDRHIPSCTCTAHFFGMIRDSWKLLKFEIPKDFNIIRDEDNAQLLTDIKKVEAAKIRAERNKQKAARDIKAPLQEGS